MAERCAVVGVGQTHHTKVRDDVSLAGLLREAARRALDDAEMTWSDIDAVVIGTAPGHLRGRDDAGAVPGRRARARPASRCCGCTPPAASGAAPPSWPSNLITGGVRKRVLTVAFEKQSEGDTTWALGGGRSGSVGAGGYFAPHIRGYIERSKAPEYVGWMVAVKDRKNALLNPYAHLKVPDISLEMVKESPMVWDPVRRLESCPASDGACAMVLTDEAGRRRRVEAGGLGARHLDAQRARPVPGPRPDQPEGGPGLRGRRLPPGRHHEPDRRRRHGRVLRAVQLVRADVDGEPRLRRARRRLEAHRGGRDRDRRQAAGQRSGGVLSSNPIGASGMLRFAEAALQVRGQAGEHQVDGVRTAVGHAYGGAAQYFAMWVLGTGSPDAGDEGRDPAGPAPARRARRARAHRHAEPARSAATRCRPR